jgi:glyoxylase-like metal-dependent hydrolase (beta-lactamase superfamily II)
MESKGVSPDEVDIVVFTHLHGDHVGWNLTADGKPTFPRARYLAPQADWDLFRQNPQSNPQMQVVVPLEQMGLLELVSGERTITSEVSTYPTPGHTPGTRHHGRPPEARDRHRRPRTVPRAGRPD